MSSLVSSFVFADFFFCKAFYVEVAEVKNRSLDENSDILDELNLVVTGKVVVFVSGSGSDSVSISSLCHCLRLPCLFLS